MYRGSANQLNIINIAIVFIASFIVWLSSFSPIYQRVDSWLSDTTQFYASTEQYFDDVIVIDIDDHSISDLTQYLGTWPYKRGDYALVLDYLYELGAETVVLDILFVDKRPEDDVLATALSKHPATVIVGGASKSIIKEEQSYLAKKALYKKLSWTPLSDRVPSDILPNALLPQNIFFNTPSQDTNVGIVAVSADNDGTLRKMPMVYSIGQSSLPSLPLSTIRANNKSNKTFDYDVESKNFIYQNYQWPIDPDGHVHLYYPQNANAVLSLAFNDVVRPALGVSEKTFMDDLFKGKTVFIGSTAIQSDMVNTPRGMMGGTYLLSIAYQNLKHELLLKPNKFGLDLLLYLIAMTPALIIIARKKFIFKQDTFTAIVIGVVIVGLNVFLLSQFSQQSSLLFPLMILCGAGALYTFHYSVVTKQQNVELSRLMDELTESNKLLEVAATTDSLTGLYNRRALLKSLEDEIERFKRSGDEFTIAVLDLDHFKQVNDTYGHKVGDDVLVEFSSLMKNRSRKIDMCGRWGGEEFVMLLPNTNSNEAITFLELLREEVEKLVVSSAPDCKITVSTGIITSTDDMIDADELISHADSALYKAKETGRNRICVFNPQ